MEIRVRVLKTLKTELLHGSAVPLLAYTQCCISYGRDTCFSVFIVALSSSQEWESARCPSVDRRLREVSFCTEQVTAETQNWPKC